MITNLVIKEANKEAHIDLERAMTGRRASWFHFEVRCSGGNIVDLVIREYNSYENLEQKQGDAPHNS